MSQVVIFHVATYPGCLGLMFAPTPVMTPASSGTGLRRASGTRQDRDAGMMELTAVRHSSKHFTRAPK